MIGLFSPVVPFVGRVTVAHASGTEQPGSFQAEVDKWQCGIWGDNESITGCFIQVVYFLYYWIPSMILLIVAHIFNVMVYISMDGSMIKNSDYILSAWTIVRDLSNIFFILILLYIAIKIILDLDAAGAKKMIARVIIVALLVNFSLFFTEVIIDSSNILGLIFYNKLDTHETGPGARPYQTLRGEKDLAGAMVAGFDPTTAFDQTFITNLKAAFNSEVHYNPNGTPNSAAYAGDPLSAPIVIMLLLIAGGMMYYVAIILAIAGLAFLIRIIELWILIIFSPFAMVSSTVPSLSNSKFLGDIGWHAWLNKLIKSSFMAPLFMFFLYFIFLLLKANIFQDFISMPNDANMMSFIITKLLNMALPLLFIYILLYKALRFAIASAGKAGELAEKGVKAAAGLAVTATVGAVTGGVGLAAGASGIAGGLATRGAASGAAALGRSTLGRFGSALAGDRGLTDWERQGGIKGLVGKTARGVGKVMGSASYDVRGVKGFDAVSSKVGLKAVGKAQEGGFKERKQAEIDKRVKRAQEITKVGENEDAMIAVREAEARLEETRNDPARLAALHNLNNGNPTGATPAERMGLGGLERELTNQERNLTDAERRLKDAIAQYGANSSQADTARDAQRDAIVYRDEARNNLNQRQADIRAQEAPVRAAENILKQAQNTVTGIERGRKMEYAAGIQGGSSSVINYVFSGGTFTESAARETARKIRAGIKEEKK